MAETKTASSTKPPEGWRVGSPGEHGFYMPEATAEHHVPLTERGFSALPRKSVRSELLDIGKGPEALKDYYLTEEDTAYAVGISLDSAEIKAIAQKEGGSGDTADTEKALRMIADARDVLNTTDLSNPDVGIVGVIKHDMQEYIASGGKVDSPKGEAFALALRLSDEVRDEYMKELAKPLSGVVGSPRDQEVSQINLANSRFVDKYNEIAQQNNAAVPNVQPTPTEPVSQTERIAKLREAGMDRIQNDPNEVLSEVLAVRADSFARFQKIRKMYETEPSDVNKKKLNGMKKELKGFNSLLDFANQWESEKLDDPATVDFATYMKNKLSDAEAALEMAIDAAGDVSIAGSNFDAVNNAYQSGWSKSSNSLNTRLMLRVSQDAAKQMNING